MTAYLPGVTGRCRGQERRALECGEHRCYQSALGSGLGLAPRGESHGLASGLFEKCRQTATMARGTQGVQGYHYSDGAGLMPFPSLHGALLVVSSPCPPETGHSDTQ